MSERLKTLAGALLALMVVYGMFFNRADRTLIATEPVTTEKGLNGYYALNKWLTGQNIKTYSLRQRFTTVVDNPEIPAARGNILITTLPYAKPMRAVENDALQDWLARGNTLIVVAALNDTPDWSLGRPLIDDLGDLTGLEFFALEEESIDDDSVESDPESNDSTAQADDASDVESGSTVEDLSDSMVTVFENGVEREYTITPSPGHPLMRNIDSLRSMSGFVSSVWVPDVGDDQFVLELATMDMTNTPIIWQQKHEYGQGQVITIGGGSLLTNRMIAKDDNRQLVVNVVQNHLGNAGTIIFDDLHQGLSAIYDPEAFFADSRLHRTLWFVIGFWLLYVVGSSNRLLTPQPEARVLKQSEFIEAIGGLINRRMAPAAVGLWMYRLWFNDLRANMGLPLNGEPVWQELAGMTMMDNRQVSKMRHQYDRLTSNRRVNLIDLHNTLREAKKAIG